MILSDDIFSWTTLRPIFFRLDYNLHGFSFYQFFRDSLLVINGLPINDFVNYVGKNKK